MLDLLAAADDARYQYAQNDNSGDGPHRKSCRTCNYADLHIIACRSAYHENRLSWCSRQLEYYQGAVFAPIGIHRSNIQTSRSAYHASRPAVVTNDLGLA